MAKRDLDKTIADMERYIQREVAAGFRNSDEIKDSAIEVFGDDADPDILAPHAERLARESVRAHWEVQQTWPDVTDCDRLDDAFEELSRAGIVCRQDFTCCGNCGAYEIGGEIAAEREAGLQVRGYAFYHMQDTESAVEGAGLYLNYGAVEASEEAALRIGREVAAALERHGLKTKWNGRCETRIHVNLDWRRRRPYEATT